MDINSLIQAITPLYNEYKQRSNTISGTEAIEIMWDIGDILKNFVEKNCIAPHKLYRMVYGKGEGAENISQKSWITREFQGRCYRIRNIFCSRNQIKKILPSLKRFRLFREAMPFFDNEKYKLQGKDREKLLKLLNSNKSYDCIMCGVRKFQKEKIGIRNTRTQRLRDMEEEKKIFINFYNSVYKLLNESSVKATNKLKEDNIDSSYITILAKNTNALSQDGLKFTNFSVKHDIQNSLWKDYGKIVKDFSSNRSAIATRRFRRIIPPERIAKLADMLYSLPLIK